MASEFSDSHWESLNSTTKRKGCNLTKYNSHVPSFSYKYHYYMFSLVIIYTINPHSHPLNLSEASLTLSPICKYVHVLWQKTKILRYITLIILLLGQNNMNFIFLDDILLWSGPQARFHVLGNRTLHKHWWPGRQPAQFRKRYIHVW